MPRMVSDLNGPTFDPAAELMSNLSALQICHSKSHTSNHHSSHAAPSTSLSSELDTGTKLFKWLQARRHNVQNHGKQNLGSYCLDCQASTPRSTSCTLPVIIFTSCWLMYIYLYDSSTCTFTNTTNIQTVHTWWPRGATNPPDVPGNEQQSDHPASLRVQLSDILATGQPCCGTLSPELFGRECLVWP